MASNEVAVCHARGDTVFTWLAIDATEFADHLEHGDGVPEGPLPGDPTALLDADCAPATAASFTKCRTGMALIDGFCIDRWEARLENVSPFGPPDAGSAITAPLIIPQGYISADVAGAACRAVGKRLCTSDEWVRTCRGYQPSQFPYGDTYISGACNEGRAVHPVIELYGSQVDWSPGQMNDPRINQLPNSLDSTGTNAMCMTEEGVFDMHGNLHEWVSDSDGKFRGGFYVDAQINGEGCSYVTTAHGTGYHDYSTGFRCCSDVASE